MSTMPYYWFKFTSGKVFRVKNPMQKIQDAVGKYGQPVKIRMKNIPEDQVERHIELGIAILHPQKAKSFEINGVTVFQR